MKTSIVLGLLLIVGIYFLVCTFNFNISDFGENLSKKVLFDEHVDAGNQNDAHHLSASFLKLKSGQMTPIYLSVFYYLLTPLVLVGLFIWFLMGLGFLQSLKKYTEQQ